MLEVIIGSAVHHKARQFLLRLLSQVKIQGLANNVRVVQIILDTKISQTPLQIACGPERNVRVLYFPHGYFLCCSPFSLFISGT